MTPKKFVVFALVGLILAVSLMTNAYLLNSNLTKGKSDSQTTTIAPETSTVTIVQPEPTTLSSTITSTRTIQLYPTSSQSANLSTGVQLVISLNASTVVDYSPYPASLQVTLQEYNIFDHPSNVSAATDWPLPDLNLFGCGILNQPFGIELFKGYLTSGNISSAANNIQYYGNYGCPFGNWVQPKYFHYLANNYTRPITWNISLVGSCCRQIIIPNCQCSPQNYIPLTPGTYTVAAGDEWSDLALVHFTVLPDPGSIHPAVDQNHQIAITNTTEYTDWCCDLVYMYQVSASYEGSSGNWTLNPNDFTIATNSDQVVYPVIGPGENNVLGGETLLPGSSASGQVGFRIPLGQQAVILDYNDSSSGIYAYASAFPRVSLYLSYILGTNVSFTSSSGKNISGLEGSALVYNLTNPGEPGFYTGDRIVTQLRLMNLQSTRNVTIVSLNVSGGFEIASIKPILPKVLGLGVLYLTVTLYAPSSTSYTGNLIFKIKIGP